MSIDDFTKSTKDVADQFSLMQKTLLVFCGLTAIGILLISIALFKGEKK